MGQKWPESCQPDKTLDQVVTGWMQRSVEQRNARGRRTEEEAGDSRAKQQVEQATLGGRRLERGDPSGADGATQWISWWSRSMDALPDKERPGRGLGPWEPWLGDGS